MANASTSARPPKRISASWAERVERSRAPPPVLVSPTSLAAGDLLSDGCCCIFDRCLRILLLLEDQVNGLCPVSPYCRHLRNVRHRHACLDRVRKALEVRVDTSYLRLQWHPGRNARIVIDDLLHRVVSSDEFGQESLGDVLVLAEGRNHEALRSH